MSDVLKDLEGKIREEIAKGNTGAAAMLTLIYGFESNPTLVWEAMESFYDEHRGEENARMLHDLLGILALRKGLTCRHR